MSLFTGSGALGIFGGAFDPVHCAHLALARAALRQLPLAQVLWIPCGQPPHRAALHASPAHRLAMVRLAVADDPRFGVDEAEVNAAQPSYTVPTLERLRAAHGARPLVLLLGADALLGLPTWHRWRELLQLAHIAVAARPGYSLAGQALPPELAAVLQPVWQEDAATLQDAPSGWVAKFEIEPVTPPDLSATQVRARLRVKPDTAAALLPAGVIDYIQAHQLY